MEVLESAPMPPLRSVVKIGSVVQIDPTSYKNKAFASCMLTVTELKSWGVMGYVQALGADRTTIGGQAYIFLKWEDMEYVGEAVWVVGD
jgi:hypothetical protein